jgi:hypothetical protein
MKAARISRMIRAGMLLLGVWGFSRIIGQKFAPERFFGVRASII